MWPLTTCLKILCLSSPVHISRIIKLTSGIEQMAGIIKCVKIVKLSCKIMKCYTSVPYVIFIYLFLFLEWSCKEVHGLCRGETLGSGIKMPVSKLPPSLLPVKWFTLFTPLFPYPESKEKNSQFLVPYYEDQVKESSKESRTVPIT